MAGGSDTEPRWGSMTWDDARARDPGRTVALLPVGAIEAHGPHLPLETDVVIARAMAREGAARLSDEDVDAVVLPPLAYTAAGFAAGFAGTISVPPEIVTGLVVAIAGNLTDRGWAVLGIANGHLDPTHLASLHAAVERCRDRELLPVVFPDVTRRPWGGRLTEEFRSGACHAGRYESSMMMAERPELVRDEIRRSLPPVSRSLSQAIADGALSFEEAGGSDGYFGDPALASAEEGRETIATLGGILAEAILASGALDDLNGLRESTVGPTRAGRSGGEDGDAG